MSTELAATEKKMTYQEKIGAHMPITKIKADVKRISGCKQMSKEAAVVVAIALDYVIKSVTDESMEKRRKNQSSIAPEVLVSVLKSRADLASVLGPDPVFVLNQSARKKKAPKEKVEGEEAPKEEKPKRKKRKVAESTDGESIAIAVE